MTDREEYHTKWLRESNERHAALVASYEGKKLEGCSFKVLTGERIVNERFGNPLTPKCGSYGAHTIMTESGREFVLWTSMGEVSLGEVVAS